MRKRFLPVCILMTCTLLAGCSNTDGPQGDEVLPGTVEDAGRTPDASDTGESGAGTGMEASGNGETGDGGIGNGNPENGESGIERSENGESGNEKSGNRESGNETSGAGESLSEASKASDLQDTGKELAAGFEEEESIVLSDKILKTGDTMKVLYPLNDDPENHGLDVTLSGAKFYDSPEEAGLDRAQMEPRTENYDVAGNPEWCTMDEGRLLVCDLTVKNINEDSQYGLHISELMIACADPDTRKVTMVSCAPAYLSASSSIVGASDYYHYQLPVGESKEIKVAWLIQENYEPENLYLGVSYDAREPEERQYFRLAGE